MEAVGGALLERLEPDPLDSASLERLLARLDEPAPSRERTILPPASRSCPLSGDADRPSFPEPLRGYLGSDPAALIWRRMAPGVVYLPVRTGGSARVRLLRCRGGARLPEHTHRGQELSLVLEGGFSDGHARFRRGDLGIGDESLRHRPVADPEGCLCLLVIDGVIRLTGPLGRLINGFIRV
jgi:putative transcriptional regulator